MALRGLTVSSSGQLLLDGIRFRNIGLNYGGAITPIYSQPSTTACAYTTGSEQDAMLAIALAMKVKVLRVKVGPYYPAQWRYGVNGGVAGVAATSGDREAHYLKLDAFVAKCRALGIGIIWCFFFRHATIPDLAGQTVRAGWLNAGATRTYAQAVTQEVVTRYLTEEAVYGYEWSNEVNHRNDATDATRGAYPDVSTGNGTNATYSAANDMFVRTDLADVITWWYGIVRAIDSSRIVLTGNGPNSYTLYNGTAGVNPQMMQWHQEQVRDNPTNCGSIHYYGNIGYGSANLRGLSGVLTGVRHWQKQAGRGFVLGEFGNQPWTMTAVSVSGGIATFTVESSCPIEAGDPFQIAGTTTFDGSYTALTVNAARTSVTAACRVSGSWTGSVKGFQHMTGARVERMCDDIISSGTDVALFWCLDNDASVPIWESLSYTGNEQERGAILAANTKLGW